MIRNGRRRHLPLIRAMLLLAFLFLLYGIGQSYLIRGHDQLQLDSSEWAYAPADSFRESTPPASGWVSYSSAPNLHNLDEFFWLRIPLPHANIREPHLQLFRFVAFQVFSNGNRIYSYDPRSQHHRLNLILHWHSVALPSTTVSEIYILSDNYGQPRHAPEIRLVNQGDLYVSLFRQNIFYFLLAAVFLFTSVIALCLYLSRKDKLQLYMSLFAFCSFYDSLVRNELLLLYWNQPWLGFLDLAVFPFAIYAFFSLVMEMFPCPLTRWLRWCQPLLLIYAVLVLAFGLLSPIVGLSFLLGNLLIAIFLLTAGIVFFQLIAAYRKHREPDTVWMLAGSILVVVFAFVHVARSYLSSSSSKLIPTPLLFDSFSFDPMTSGLLLFMVCLIRAIIYRFRSMKEKLEDIGQFLEQSVRDRTAELDDQTLSLQETNARLERTTRETAEMIAASLLLEERNLLTGQIHDTVGHAMTAAIIQLEAARRLLNRDSRLALDKLSASQALIRKGLDEIQQAEHWLPEDPASFRLEEAMIELMTETERTTEVRFEWHLDPLPESLSSLHRRLLYQALQEGITNGLRHSGSTQFQFTLTVYPAGIRFRLASNGLTYTPQSFGFGLNAMSEKAAQYGGRMSIEPGHPGCLLLVTLPLDGMPLSIPAQEVSG